jgi:hypothetical protein
MLQPTKHSLRRQIRELKAELDTERAKRKALIKGLKSLLAAK